MFVFVYGIFFCEQPDFNSDFTFSNGEICTFPRPDGTEHVSDFAIVQPRRVDRPGYGQQARLSTSFVDNAIGFCSVLFTLVVPVDTGISLQHRI